MAQLRQPTRVTRVLLVEDNPGDADLVCLALQEGAEAGTFEVQHVTRLAEALAHVSSTPPDAVLLDLSLPDAFELDGLRRLNGAAPDVPIVVLTGSSNGEIGPAALQAGAQDYLVKGTDLALVRRALRYAVERNEHSARARLLAQERAARAAAETARERMAVLAAASTAVAHSLDDRHALTSLASALVPRFADWCAIKAGGTEECAPGWITVHRDPAAADGVSARLDPLPDAGPESWRGPGAVGASGQVELQRDTGADSTDSMPTPWRAALDALGVRSAMIVPVRLTDDVLGVMVFARSRAPGGAFEPFEPDDFVLAEEIGRRVAVAIANCRLYREARLAATARDEFMSVAAHELRTPVAVLQLKLQQVEMKQQASICGTCEHAVPADYRGAARQIARLGKLIEALLDVSRVVGGRVKLERKEVDLRELARDVIDHLAELAARNQSTIVLVCDEPVRGAWDRLAMERILGNLLSNALKFGAQKPVEIRIRYEGEDAEIVVEDHGIGIASDDVDRIFDQFERAVSARHFGGLGLGLYITRRLVEEHGGSIAVSSRPGSGSVFKVRLPRAVHA